MRFMTVVRSKETGAVPPPAMFEAVDQLIAEASAKGILVSFGGLMPTAQGSIARLEKGKVVFTDGPFSEAKEVLGGFAIYDVKSKEEMNEWTRRFLELHAKIWPEFTGSVEIRQMYEGQLPGEPDGK